MHRSERLLVLLSAGSAILAVAVWLALRPSEEIRPLERVDATWTLEPRWGRPVAAADPPAGGAGELAIYLDSSLPIGGFLPPAGHSAVSVLEALVRLAPHHLAGADRGAQSGLRWHRIAGQPSRLERAPSLERRFFTGGESRLDLAVREIESDFAAGRLEAAMLITDLVATGEIVGAQGTSQALRAWVQSDAVLGGGLDLGLLAVRGRYWGIRAPSCRAPRGEVACFFSEQRQEWLPLPADSQLPLYVLVFTRGRAPVSRILDDLASELKQLNFAVEMELLTSATAAGDDRLADCEVRSKEDPERPQYVLFGGAGATFRCERDEVVQLRCRLPEEVAVVKAAADPQDPRVQLSMVEERTVQLELDCEQNRDRELRLKLSLQGEAAAPADSRWADWSAITDDRREDLGKTLRLREFVETIRVRPGAYAIQLRLAPSGAGK